MKIFFPTLLVSLFSFTLHATVEEFRLTTPRGSKVEVKVHIPEGLAPGSKAPALVLAPGQSCNWKGELFEKLADEAAKQSFSVFRMNWAYCLEHPGDFTPSPDLVNEVEDLQSLLDSARLRPFVAQDKIFIAGKSQGSRVANAILMRDPLLRGYLFLTPVVSYPEDDNGNPLPAPRPVGQENYPGLQDELRPGFFGLGNVDVLGNLPIFYSFLSNFKGSTSVAVVGGGHGLNISKPDGQPDLPKTSQNIQALVLAAANWLTLQL